MKAALLLVLVAGCADEPRWNLTASVELPAVVLDDTTPSASFHVHLAFPGPLAEPDGSLGFSPQIDFVDAGDGTILFEAILHDDATGFESTISYSYQSWGPAFADDIRTFAWRDCEDDCALDYTLTVAREPYDGLTLDAQVTGLVNTYLTAVGSDTPPAGAAIAMTIDPI